MRKTKGMNGSRECCDPVVNVSKISHDEWLEFRRSGIGGSDAATIVGLNPWSSQYALFCDKMGALPEKDDNEAMRQGRDLEQYVASRWSERTGKKCQRSNYMWRSRKWPWMLADIDRAVVGENAGLECKTTSANNRHDFEGGEIPLNYYVQCQHYMAVLGFDRMYLAVLVLGKGFFDFVVERDDDEIVQLAKAESDFWQRIQDEDPPPIDGSEATQEAIRAVHPKEAAGFDMSLPADVNNDLFTLSQLMASRKEIDEQIMLIKSSVMDRMGNSAAATTRDFKCTWQTRARQTVDSKRLKAEHPEIYKQYTKTTTSRVFSFKALKEDA